MVAISSTNGKDLMAFRELIQLFIDGKMNSYNRVKVSCDVKGESTSIDKRKYRASLFMLHRMLRTMEINEIVEMLELPFDLLNEWRSEKAFTTLVYSNYKEFLIYLGELYT
jgi:hypothetical protein